MDWWNDGTSNFQTSQTERDYRKAMRLSPRSTFEGMGDDSQSTRKLWPGAFSAAGITDNTGVGPNGFGF